MDRIDDIAPVVHVSAEIADAFGMRGLPDVSVSATENEIRERVIDYIRRNPSQAAPLLIKRAAGLEPDDPQYCGFLSRMVDEGILGIEGCKAFANRRWGVLRG